MPNEKFDLMTSGKMAKALGVSDAKVKKAIKALKIKADAKKGVCNYYSQGALAKIKSTLK